MNKFVLTCALLASCGAMNGEVEPASQPQELQNNQAPLSEMPAEQATQTEVVAVVAEITNGAATQQKQDEKPVEFVEVDKKKETENKAEAPKTEEAAIPAAEPIEKKIAVAEMDENKAIEQQQDEKKDAPTVPEASTIAEAPAALPQEEQVLQQAPQQAEEPQVVAVAETKEEPKEVVKEEPKEVAPPKENLVSTNVSKDSITVTVTVSIPTSTLQTAVACASCAENSNKKPEKKAPEAIAIHSISDLGTVIAKAVETQAEAQQEVAKPAEMIAVEAISQAVLIATAPEEKVETAEEKKEAVETAPEAIAYQPAKTFGAANDSPDVSQNDPAMPNAEVQKQSIRDIQNNGRFILVDNDVVYRVPGPLQKKTQLWKKGDAINIKITPNSKWVRIINLNANVEVMARVETTAQVAKSTATANSNPQSTAEPDVENVPVAAPAQANSPELSQPKTSSGPAR